MAQMPIEVIAIGDIPPEHFESVVALANSTQTEFSYLPFNSHEAKAFKTLSYKQAAAKDVIDKIEVVRAQIGGYHPFVIVLVDTELEGREFVNLFGSHRAEKGIALFTTANVGGAIVPTEKISAYVLYYFARYTLSFIVPQHKNHNDTRECIFDRKIHKYDVIKSMKARAICDECRDQLLSGEVKLSPAQLDALDMLFALSGKLLKEDVEIPVRSLKTDKSDPLAELTKIKNHLDANAHGFARRGLWLYFLVLVGIGILLVVLTYLRGWNVMEPWTYFIGLSVTLGSYIYFVLTQKELSPKTIYEQIIESKKRKNYQESGFDIEQYEKLLDAEKSSRV